MAKLPPSTIYLPIHGCCDRVAIGVPASSCMYRLTFPGSPPPKKGVVVFLPALFIQGRLNAFCIHSTLACCASSERSRERTVISYTPTLNSSTTLLRTGPLFRLNSREVLRSPLFPVMLPPSRRPDRLRGRARTRGFVFGVPGQGTTLVGAERLKACDSAVRGLINCYHPGG